MPEGFDVDFLGAHTWHALPPGDMPLPLNFGIEEALDRLFKGKLKDLTLRRWLSPIFCLSLAHAVGDLCPLFWSYDPGI